MTKGGAQRRATMPAVTSRTPLLHNRRLAMALAVLALFAQLWAGQAGTAHLAQMLSEQFLRGDVCSAQAAPTHSGDSLPDSPQGGHAMAGALGCPVCSVATVGFTAAGSAPTVAAAQAPALQRAVFASVPARAPRHANLMPPAQAPPTAWS